MWIRHRANIAKNKRWIQIDSRHWTVSSGHSVYLERSDNFEHFPKQHHFPKQRHFPYVSKREQKLDIFNNMKTRKPHVKVALSDFICTTQRYMFWINQCRANENRQKNPRLDLLIMLHSSCMISHSMYILVFVFRYPQFYNRIVCIWCATICIGTVK